MSMPSIWTREYLVEEGIVALGGLAGAATMLVFLRFAALRLRRLATRGRLRSLNAVWIDHQQTGHLR